MSSNNIGEEKTARRLLARMMRQLSRNAVEMDKITLSSVNKQRSIPRAAWRRSLRLRPRCGRGNATFHRARWSCVPGFGSLFPRLWRPRLLS